MIPQKISDKRILISSLNWGMGHVARCISLIYKLKNNNNQIWIAASSNQQNVFKTYFPELQYLPLTDYPFKFSEKRSFAKAMIYSALSLYSRLIKEKRIVNEWQSSFNFDLIITDQRYSFRSSKCISIFLTHQLNLPDFRFSFIFKTIHRYHLKKFNYIWICDFEDSRLAGNLSINNKYPNSFYIGPLSRFDFVELNPIKSIDSTLILSGPKAFRSYLLEYFLSKVDDTQKICIVTPSQFPVNIYQKYPALKRIEIHVSSDWKKTDEIILNSKQICSFTGYSTIMDLTYLQIKADLIPTPGQQEQIYLHKLHA
ncbi:MAG: hypothetical protein P8I93_05740 [Crocinitomicaceae bacterium]|nr:hypothetical protein [Crocinitomicaceae bacterium]